MNTIGSHPGAILFRLSIMIILIAILYMVFLSYFDKTQKTVERTSILQTKKIIDSTLALVFANHAVKGDLAGLNDLDGANPFEFLANYQLTPPGYKGVIDHDLNETLGSGWYYLAHRNMVVYKPFHLEMDSYFKVILKYQDIDQSGHFEPAVDRFQSLQFVRVGKI